MLKTLFTKLNSLLWLILIGFVILLITPIFYFWKYIKYSWNNTLNMLDEWMDKMQK